MALFRNKCENEEYLQMNCFIDFIEGLLKKDEFISKSMYMNQYQETTPLFNEFISLRNKNVLDSYCKKQKINFRKMIALISEVFQKVKVKLSLAGKYLLKITGGLLYNYKKSKFFKFFSYNLVF